MLDALKHFRNREVVHLVDVEALTCVGASHDDVGTLESRFIDGIEIRRTAVHFSGLSRPHVTLHPNAGIASLGGFPSTNARCFSCDVLWRGERAEVCWFCGEHRWLPHPRQGESYATT
jgi:hypothetical protein